MCGEIYMHTHIYTYMCVCVCVAGWSSWVSCSYRKLPNSAQIEEVYQTDGEGQENNPDVFHWTIHAVLPAIWEQQSHSNLPGPGPVTIIVTDVLQIKSWRAPGHGMIDIYWQKKLTALHEHLAARLNQLLIHERQQGRTVLIPMDPQKVPSKDQ